jgi:hypothetical protein
MILEMMMSPEEMNRILREGDPIRAAARAGELPLPSNPIAAAARVHSPPASPVTSGTIAMSADSDGGYAGHPALPRARGEFGKLTHLAKRKFQNNPKVVEFLKRIEAGGDLAKKFEQDLATKISDTMTSEVIGQKVLVEIDKLWRSAPPSPEDLLEKLFDGVPLADQGGRKALSADVAGDSMTLERRAELLGSTVTGRAMLEAEGGAASPAVQILGGRVSLSADAPAAELTAEETRVLRVAQSISRHLEKVTGKAKRGVMWNLMLLDTSHPPTIEAAREVAAAVAPVDKLDDGDLARRIGNFFRN